MSQFQTPDGRMIPRVSDISHHNVGTLKGGDIDFGAMAAAGVWGIIHKASQGVTVLDDVKYAGRRKAALAAGLLWGAYHFNTGEPIKPQVDNFLDAAKPDADTLLVLDFEQNPSSSGQMSMAGAVDFLRQVQDRTGRKAAIYGGNWIKEHIGELGPLDRAYLCSHRLWLCQYGPKATLPPGWPSWWLWQYTGDGIGPLPHGVPGIAGSGVDLNVYDGPREKLAAEWAGASAATAPTVSAPPAAPAKPGKTIADMTPAEIAQTALNKLGAAPALLVDGDFGAKSRSAAEALLS